MRIDNVRQEPVSAKDFTFSVPTGLTLPPRTNNRVWVGGIENQGRIGSCVANATSSALEMLLQRGGKFVDVSRLFVYYNVRKGHPELEGKDRGAYLSDGFKCVYKLGVPPEAVWPYDEARVHDEPSAVAYELAKQMKVQKFQRVGQFNAPNNLQRIKTTIAMGYPVTIALPVYDSIGGMTGKLSDPSCHYKGEGLLLGGHAMLAVDYDDDLNGFITEQSWGSSYGDGGLFVIDYKVIEKSLMDAWVCTSFAGIDQKPDFSWTPTDPIVAAVTEYPNVIQFKEKTANQVMYGYLMQGTATGGEPPYTYEWTTSDPSVTLQEGQFSAPQVDLSGWFMDELRSVRITCVVSDSQIPAQQTTASTLIKFCNGVDINSPQGQAYRLYRACLGRTPDQEGLMYWTNEIARGMELREAAERFMDSEEFHTLYGNVSDKEFVTLMYLHVLHREPDTVGHEYWMGRILDGYPRQDVLVSFSESPENKEGARW